MDVAAYMTITHVIPNGAQRSVAKSAESRVLGLQTA